MKYSLTQDFSQSSFLWGHLRASEPVHSTHRNSASSWKWEPLFWADPAFAERSAPLRKFALPSFKLQGFRCTSMSGGDSNPLQGIHDYSVYLKS